MRFAPLKISLLLMAFAGTGYCIGSGPAGNPILNSDAYQQDSQMYVDTVQVRGIMQLPYGVTLPSSYLCNASSHTGRIYIATSAISGNALVYVCEGVNGWQIKSSTGSAGGGGSPAGASGSFQYNNGGNFGGSSDLTTNSSTVTATNFRASTITVTGYSRFENVSTTTWQSVSTVTFGAGILIDMSGIANSNLGEGFVIPQAADCSNAIRNGQICWDNDDHFLYFGNGTGVQVAVPIGSANLGTSLGPVLLSTPTALINFSSSVFSGSAVNVTTAAISLNSSSVTLQGNSFNAASKLAKLDSSGYLTLSSASFTHSYQQSILTLPIVQIQYYHTETSSFTANTGFTLTKLSGSFTPKFTTSKVILIAQGVAAQNVGDGGYYTFTRNRTNLAPNNGGFMGTVSGNNYDISMIYYDSPATTSAVTYAVEFRTAGGGSTTVFPVTLGGLVPSAGMFAIEIAQ